MLHHLSMIVLLVSFVLAWRQSAAPIEPAGLRPRLLLAFALALGLRLALELVHRLPAGVAQSAAVLASEAVALTLFAVFIQLSLAGTWKKGARLARLIPAILAGLTLWQHQRDAAIFFGFIGLMRHPWISGLKTTERFRASLACLVVLLALVFRVERAEALAPVLSDAQDIALFVRGVVMASAGFGLLRAFKAFTTDPTLGIRRVSRRLALSHVLVVTVPLLIVVALWISSTYLGVNADRALVTARAVDHEAHSLREAIAVALGARHGVTQDARAAARAVAESRLPHWPGTRVFVVRDSMVERRTGDAVPGEGELAGWVAGFDTLPQQGVVELSGRRWLGAAVKHDGVAVVVLAPIAEVLDSTLSPLMGAKVTMSRLGRSDSNLDSLRTSIEAARDSLRDLSREPANGRPRVTRSRSSVRERSPAHSACRTPRCLCAGVRRSRSPQGRTHSRRTAAVWASPVRFR